MGESEAQSDLQKEQYGLVHDLAKKADRLASENDDLVAALENCVSWLEGANALADDLAGQLSDSVSADLADYHHDKINSSNAAIRARNMIAKARGEQS